MTDKQINETNEIAPNDSIEELHYEEPPAMTAKDSVGVAVAIIALGVIGYLGYIWLTPGKDITTMFTPPKAATEEASNQSDVSSSGSAEHLKCATCGMFAEKSASHVIANWADGSSTDHDSWDCAFGYAVKTGLDMLGAEVSHFGSPIESPHFLDAITAWYLYDTEVSIEGSMPPFVAAFATNNEAASIQAEMGGEVLDYTGLAAKWDVASIPMGAEHSSMDMPDHNMAQMDSINGEVESSPDANESLKPHEHDHEMNCAYCGMFADKSKSHVVVEWADETHTHHDCWDCALFYGSEEGLNLSAAQVTLIDSPAGDPQWINAEAAWYLYDTDKSVEGSMPPFVVAFESMEAAHASHDEWGGEVVDFAGLQSKWH